MKSVARVFFGLMVCGSFTQFVSAEGPGIISGVQSAGQFPVVNGKGSLTIAGRGYWHRDIYLDGEHPSLSVYDNSGQLLPDGVYRYEFRSFPEGADSSPRQQELLRTEGRGASQGKGKSQVANKLSGSFEVQGGQLVLR